MASNPEFVRFACDQIRHAGTVRYRKMFGEYAIYCDDKVVALICDNRFYLKPTAAAQALLPQPVLGSPYPGAKPYLLLGGELEDAELASRLVATTAAAMPAPPPGT